MIYTHVLARPDIRVVSPLDRLELPEVKKVPEVQALGASGVSSQETVSARENEKKEMEEVVTKAESAEEIFMAERRSTLKNEKNEEVVITTAELHDTLSESDFALLNTDGSDARTQVTSGNWIRRARDVVARIVFRSRRESN